MSEDVESRRNRFYELPKPSSEAAPPNPNEDPYGPQANKEKQEAFVRHTERRKAEGISGREMMRNLLYTEKTVVHFPEPKLEDEVKAAREALEKTILEKVRKTPKLLPHLKKGLEDRFDKTAGPWLDDVFVRAEKEARAHTPLMELIRDDLIRDIEVKTAPTDEDATKQMAEEMVARAEVKAKSMTMAEFAAQVARKRRGVGP